MANAEASDHQGGWTLVHNHRRRGQLNQRHRAVESTDTQQQLRPQQPILLHQVSHSGLEYYNRSAFLTLLCGAFDSEVVFAKYCGYSTNSYWRRDAQKGRIVVPLFQPATRIQEIRTRFDSKMQKLASLIMDYENSGLTVTGNGDYKLKAHLRIGDLSLRRDYLLIYSRPGPTLKDFNLLLEEDTYLDGLEKLSMFLGDWNGSKKVISTNFDTEKCCGSQAAIEAFLISQGFKAADHPDEWCLSVSLMPEIDGERFDLYYDLKELQLIDINVINKRWNLNLVSAKGTDYRGDFRDQADLRLQFDTSFVGKNNEAIVELLETNRIDRGILERIFDRVDGDNHPLTSGFLQETRHYRLRPHPCLTSSRHFREQHNRTFVLHHDRWPLMVKLREFKFYQQTVKSDSTVLFESGACDVEHRVIASFACDLNPEVLREREFVTYVWECCRLMQALIAESLKF